MEYNINKKLLSEILNENVSTVLFNTNDDEDNNLYYSDIEDADFIDCFSVNIYELIAKIQKFCNKNGYDVYVSFNGSCPIQDSKIGEWGQFPCREFYKKDNPLGATLEACQWILDNKGDDNATTH